ncbi:MAG: efflux RND transporter permease subunit [Gammaproteobacteria bacterium]|nr:efflux RND transporter permease subunit [Gammaproteobacteria bacterium]
MSIVQNFLQNHVLANATFVVVLVVGALTYLQMPRSQDPEINFNWISVVTIMPGVSASDVEKLITDPLEEAIQQVTDIKFVSSTSRESVSNILVRFNDISDRTFDKRLNDLRREIQNKANAELPDAAEDPRILEITSANSFPSATLVVSGNAEDEMLRQVALNVKQDIERIRGVDDVNTAALVEPELQVEFFTEQLRANGITPTQLADTIQAFFRDTAAGNLKVGNQQWLVRLIGTDADPGYLAQLPIISAKGEVSVNTLARVSRGRENANQAVSVEGRPAVMLSITKQAFVNTLDLLEDVDHYIHQKNKVIEQFGVTVSLLDDQSVATRTAIGVMQSNALLGLLLVMFVTWLFLGAHIAFFLGLGIPFTLAGTFWLLSVFDQTINQSVLLGVVIVLGMLVDDAVVVVEAIYYRIQRGVDAMQAALAALREVFSPVTSSVMTTMAAFLPLMLLPGILGDFMFVIPFVVTVALALSLLEAYWVLPVHVTMVKLNLTQMSRIQALRVSCTHWLRIVYCRALIKVLRRPRMSLLGVLFLLFFAVSAFAMEMVKVQFFAFDPIRLFYVNIEMPPGTTLQDTLRQVEIVEKKVRKHLLQGEARGIAAAAGQMFTEMTPFFGDQYGQLTVSLNSRSSDMRGVAEIIDSMRAEVLDTLGPNKISFLILEGGPPKGKPISIKVRGDDFESIGSAVSALRDILTAINGVSNISDDDSQGKLELLLKFDTDAIRDAQLNPADMARTIRLLFDGEIVASMQHQGRQLDVRVRADPREYQNIDSVLEQAIALPSGGVIALRQLVQVNTVLGKGNIRHYNFKRTVTVEADLDKDIIDTIAANELVNTAWLKVAAAHSSINLDFSGEMDDIQESLDSMLVLALFGLGLIYLILGSQFKSYWQPFMILSTVPLAFTGVTLGLVVTQNPLSLFTIYGVVALIGIAVNSAIVMIHASNQRLDAGMTVLHATVYAARRRVVPIVITSLTTIAGLFSLAAGLGGKSLLWGPVASAIVWGLAFSTVLTLFVVPLLYRTFMQRSRKIALQASRVTGV